MNGSGSRDSMASGIISMYESSNSPRAPAFGASTASPQAYSSPAYSTAEASSSSYFSAPLPDLSLQQPYSANNPLRPAYPSPSPSSISSPSATTSYPRSPEPQSAQWDYTSQQRQNGAPSPGPPRRYESTEGLRDRARPSFSSASGRAMPSDGFYSSEPPLPERKQSLDRIRMAEAQQAGSGADWRTKVEAGSIYEGRATPLRQPTIVTTPPIGSNGFRNPSISSQSSAATSSHPTFSSTWTGTTRRPGGTLSPNTSLTASSALHRADSAGSVDSYDPSGMPEYLNPAFLSNVAVFVKDQVPRGLRVKGAVEHPQSFTGEEVVVRCLLSRPTASDELTFWPCSPADDGDARAVFGVELRSQVRPLGRSLAASSSLVPRGASRLFDGRRDFSG